MCSGLGEIMSIVTALTRMWLTRSMKPFVFINQNDKCFEYSNEKNLGLYVHIPFCRQICDFCPYCKELYNQEKCNAYIDALINEIHLVGNFSKEKKAVTSLYFGGGSPALAIDRLKEIIDVLNIYFDIKEGIGIELHPDDLTVSVLKELKAAGITKISIGVQSFQKKYQAYLGRACMDTERIKKVLEEAKFETVSMDFIFALPNQSFEDLKEDIDTAFLCGANHVAIYPFIDFTFTKSEIKAMDKKEKRRLLDAITMYCEEKGYTRDSIWTFSNNDNARYSSMTRDSFLGFGCSATTLLKEQFKINTFSVNEYIKCIDKKVLPTSLTLKFSLRQRMVYYLFWTAYSTRVSSENFKDFFGVSLKKMYGLELLLAKRLGFVTEENGIYTMTLKGAFYYHYYEGFYTLAYIDKMWSVMRKTAFPEGLEL